MAELAPASRLAETGAGLGFSKCAQRENKLYFKRIDFPPPRVTGLASAEVATSF
jgi:hypothetical protein